MTRAPKSAKVVADYEIDRSDSLKSKEIQVRLEIVKTLVVLENFMELALPVQLEIIATLVKYIMTGKK
jgi:hypothetical protein